MDSNKTVGATFTKDTADTDGDGFSNYDELVTYSTDPADNTSYPTRTLTAESATNGSIDSTATHKLGATTTATAVSATGYLFSAWTGASTGTENPLTLTMDGNKTIGATFAKDTVDTDGDGFSNYDEIINYSTDPADNTSYPTRTLTAEAATNGSITSTKTHKLNSTASIEATPSSGYLFIAWTGANTGSDNPLTLTMNGNKTIGASFTKDTADTDGDGFSNYDELVTYSTNPSDSADFPQVPLTVTATTNGSISVSGGSKLGSVASITATPSLGYLFSAWTGANTGSDNPLSLTMDSAKTIGASFTKDTADTDGDGFSNYDELVTHSTDPADNTSYPTRTLTAEATTNGSITSTATHKLGATTTVTAEPATGYLFTAWTGANTGTENPLTLTVDVNKTIGASFTKDTADTDGDGFSNYDEVVTYSTDPGDNTSYPTRTLTAQAATNGSITSTATHKLSTTTTVTAVPATGYLFSAWTGANTGTENPLTLTMDGNKTIGATFTKDTVDTDGDGFSNYDELVTHSTDPADSNNYPIAKLKVINPSNGTVTANSSYKLNTIATLTATPDTGYLFSTWTNSASGNNASLFLVMGSDKTIGATFTKDTADTDNDGFSNYDELVTYSTDPVDASNYPTRTLTAEATANGSITSADTHKLGATTTATAVPATGYLFTAWTGAGTGTENPLTLTMDGNKTIGATFTKDTADTDGDGFSNYDELVTHETDPSDANNYPTRTLSAEASANGSITSTATHKLGA
ncbi:hypothetical protein OAK69_01160, partial [bacterium]|nr:hypothetical protein [bacterium]